MSQRKTEYTETGFDPGGHPFATQGKQIVKSDITPSNQLDEREKMMDGDKEFVSVKGQLYRYYDVPAVGQGNGTTIRIYIKEPQWLHVRKGGAHEVVDLAGEVHYIPKHWVHLAWKNAEGERLSRF